MIDLIENSDGIFVLVNKEAKLYIKVNAITKKYFVLKNGVLEEIQIQ